MLWKMAFQFTKKQWKRNLLVMGAIALSVFVMIFLSGLMAGIKNEFQEKAVREGGHLRFHASGWSQQTDSLRLDPVLDNPERTMTLLKEISGIQSVEEVLPFGAILLKDDKNFFTEVDGSEPDGFATSSIRKSLKSGVFDLNDKRIVLSVATAKLLNVKVGDSMTVLTQDSTDMPFYRDFVVSGLFDTGNEASDENHAFISMQQSRDLTGLGRAGLEIRALLNDPESAPKVRTAILDQLPQEKMEIQTWKESQGSFLVFLEVFDVFMIGINFFIVIVAAAVITNALLMNFLERLPIIASLRAVGMRRQGALGLVLREGAIQGVLGTFVGFLLGCLSVWSLSGNGLDMGQAGAALGIGSTIPFKLDLKLLLQSCFAGLLTVFIASIYTGVTGARTPILEGLREE